jgi:hypothetical protein
VAVVGELEPAGVPQHVGMNDEAKFRRRTFAALQNWSLDRVTAEIDDFRNKIGTQRTFTSQDPMSALCPNNGQYGAVARGFWASPSRIQSVS